MKPSERLRRALVTSRTSVPPCAPQDLTRRAALAPSAAALAPSAAALAPQPDADSTASERSRRVAQLRREIDRIMKARPPARDSASAAQQAVAPRPAAPLSGADASRHGQAALPAAVDQEGLLYRHDFPPDGCLGRCQVGPPGAEALTQLRQVLRLSLGEVAEGTPEPGDLLFLDIETTGLSHGAGTLAFLIGLGYYPGGAGQLRVDQILLREPALEPQALELLCGYLARARLLVTFNGRGFDVPVLQNRGVLCRRLLPLPPGHLDLLPLCRALFRPRQLDCRLATLERQQLGFVRQGDVPGAEAPRIYADFLRSGRTEALQQIMSHNLLDVAAMAALLPLVSCHLAEPLRWAEDGEELLAIARLYLRRGLGLEAERCLAQALTLARLPDTRRQLLVTWAAHLRRAKRLDEAAVVWQRYCAEFPEHHRGWVELAKYHEHVTRDLPLALRLAQRASGQPPPELQHRLARLRRRLAT